MNNDYIGLGDQLLLNDNNIKPYKYYYSNQYNTYGNKIIGNNDLNRANNYNDNYYDNYSINNRPKGIGEILREKGIEIEKLKEEKELLKKDNERLKKIIKVFEIDLKKCEEKLKQHPTDNKINNNAIILKEIKQKIKELRNQQNNIKKYCITKKEEIKNIFSNIINQIINEINNKDNINTNKILKDNINKEIRKLNEKNIQLEIENKKLKKVNLIKKNL